MRVVSIGAVGELDPVLVLGDDGGVGSLVALGDDGEVVASVPSGRAAPVGPGTAHPTVHPTAATSSAPVATVVAQRRRAPVAMRHHLPPVTVVPHCPCSTDVTGEPFGCMALPVCDRPPAGLKGRPSASPPHPRRPPM
jgi:hypothetical protein